MRKRCRLEPWVDRNGFVRIVLRLETGMAREQPADFGNWVPRRMVYLPLGGGVACLLLSRYSGWALVPAAIGLLVGAYFAYARYEFSAGGGRVQEQIVELVLRYLDWDGRGQALDIGCGNGALTVRLAQRFPGARAVGVDTWGSNWEYGERSCRANAARSGVGARATFQEGSAAHLPFADESFDAVVSNLVFHEVRGVPDKRLLVREALRVLRKGGTYAFQDLLLIGRMYGPTSDLVDQLRRSGLRKVEFIPTRDEPFIPSGLKAPFMVGTMAVLRGQK